MPPTVLQTERGRKVGWKLVSTASGIVGGLAARKVVDQVWAAFVPSDREPPLNPADRDIEWKTALQWAIAAGVGASIARLLSQRAAAAAWECATGSAPPGIDT